jgi:RHS repeat-associated protein
MTDRTTTASTSQNNYRTRLTAADAAVAAPAPSTFTATSNYSMVSMMIVGLVGLTPQAPGTPASPPSPDTTPPSFSGLSSTPQITSASVSSSAGETSSRWVDYGTTTSYGMTAGTGALTSGTKSIGLSDLACGTVYHYRFRGSDTWGNEGTSADATFTTRVCWGGASTIRYVRDATDRLVARVELGETVRYGYSSSGDTADFTQNPSGSLLESFHSFAGGALLTRPATGAANDLWSFPNIHGDVVALVDATGVKQGATLAYDPYGSPLGGQPDNATGRLDNGWLGQHQRATETGTGIATIEMGARAYSPGLGRFLEVDPVEGGSANDYDYVAGDPVNNLDLDGRCKSRSGSWLKRRGCNIVNAGRSAVNAGALTGGVGPTEAGMALTYATGGSCRTRRTLNECTGAHFPGGQPAFTMGDTVISRKKLDGDVFEHERRHSYQYGALGGWGFVPAYFTAYAIQGQCNVFEGSAGYGRGGYSSC